MSLCGRIFNMFDKRAGIDIGFDSSLLFRERIYHSAVHGGLRDTIGKIIDTPNQRCTKERRLLSR